MDDKKNVTLEAIDFEIDNINKLLLSLSKIVLFGVIFIVLFTGICVAIDSRYLIVIALIFWILFVLLSLKIQDDLFQKKIRLVRLRFVETCFLDK